MLYRAAQHTSPANRSWGVLSNPLGAAANDFIEPTSAPHPTWTASAGGDGRGHDPSIVQLAPHHQSAAPRPTRGLCTPCPVAQSVCQRLACLLALHSLLPAGHKRRWKVRGGCPSAPQQPGRAWVAAWAAVHIAHPSAPASDSVWHAAAAAAANGQVNVTWGSHQACPATDDVSWGSAVASNRF